MSRLAGQRALGIHLLLPLLVLGLQTLTCLVFHTGAGDLNLGPNACVTSTLLTELSPQSLWPAFAYLFFVAKAGLELTIFLPLEC